MIDNLLVELSNNKLFGGAIMLLTNIGGKYLAQELPTNLEKMFSQYFILRYLVLFSIFFMATRDIKISILLSLLFFIFIKFFINENSTFCLVSDNHNQIINNKISKEEYEKAKMIVEKFNNSNK
jgi:fatty-acid desaturase